MIYEALSALVHSRKPRPLYHSALVVSTAEGRFVVEMTPIRDAGGRERGVVAEGPVGGAVPPVPLRDPALARGHHS